MAVFCTAKQATKLTITATAGDGSSYEETFNYNFGDVEVIITQHQPKTNGRVRFYCRTRVPCKGTYSNWFWTGYTRCTIPINNYTTGNSFRNKYSGCSTYNYTHHLQFWDGDGQWDSVRNGYGYIDVGQVGYNQALPSPTYNIEIKKDGETITTRNGFKTEPEITPLCGCDDNPGILQCGFPGDEDFCCLDCGLIAGKLYTEYKKMIKIYGIMRSLPRL